MRPAALLLLAAFAATAVESPPVPGPAKDFRLPEQRRFALPNGMKVTMVQWGDVPKVLLLLTVATGSIDEQRGETWLSGLTADMLPEGTQTRSAAKIAEAAAAMGGELAAEAGNDLTHVTLNVLAEFAGDAARLLADVARNPSFPAADFERRRTDRLRDLSIERSQPQPLAQEKFLAALYPEHPYGRLFPTPAELQALTVEKARAFYAANFGAARAHLYVVGRFEPGPLEQVVREAFGDWKPGTEAAPRPPAPHAERKLYLVDRPGAVQSTLILGMPVIDPSNPDYIKLVVANALLGGSFSSRITSNIREQKGYTYSPRSAISSHRRDASWAETADVTTKDTGASLKEILGEIARLKTEPPPEAELRGVQRYVAGTFVLRNSSRDGIAQQLVFVDLQGLPDDWLTTYVQRVQAVTPKDVQEVTARYIQDARAAIVVVGDLKTVREQVAPLAPAAP
jgi:predicted Zn-dependent peptidase